MLPHRPLSDAPQRRRERSQSQAMDLAWLEERALRYAARQEASAGAVAALLERKVRERCERTHEASEPVLDLIPTLIEKLIERGYVDDERFAAGLLERERRQGASIAKIRARLAAKGVAESTVDRLAAEEDPESETRAAWKFARRRRLGPCCDDPVERPRLRDRHLAALCRQGFELDLALRIVDADAPPESI